jgi:hypothetical protein
MALALTHANKTRLNKLDSYKGNRLTFLCNYVSLSVSGRIQTLDLRIMSQVFYHCPTGVQLCLMLKHFYVISALSKKVVEFQPLILRLRAKCSTTVLLGYSFV